MSTPFSPSLIVRLGLVVALLLASCTGPQGLSTLPKTKALPVLMVERLSWMDEVASVKQAKSLPVTDPKREAELLNAMEEQGERVGLPPQAVRAFFAGQMEAAKQLQKEWIKKHPQGVAFTPENGSARQPLPDLAATVRPALDGIGKQMLGALARARREHPAENDRLVSSARAALVSAGYSKAVIQQAVGGLESGLK